MLHKHRGHAFGGMWVFPGGRLDPEDGTAEEPEVERARRAAAREAAEEAAIVVDPDDLVAFAHWTPPPEAPRRFATWFFVVEAVDVTEVVVDGEEIADHAWVSPDEALSRHELGEIELAIPTWVTLHGLRGAASPASVLEAARSADIVRYATRITALEGAMLAMWEGDAGYHTLDPTTEGQRHRLHMPEGARWIYERS
jgi:8-oxo-dGTP pyrophosphatase MutT (NUDIX family)